ncbi:glycosyltransferase family 4 protein [Thermococcus atlanticus]
MKIAIASDWFYPKVGGIEAHMDELARHLLDAGHEPHVITHDYRYLTPYNDGFPYPVHRFRGSVYLRDYHISLSPGQLWRINGLYKSVDFDVTHVHSIYSPFSIAVANLSRGIRGVPVVATNHSFFGEPRLGGVIKSLLRYYLRRMDAFVAVSTPVAEDTRKLLGRSLGNRIVTTIPNGIDVEYWRPPEEEEREKARDMLNLGGNEIALLYVGRMTERKQAHRLPFVISKALEMSGTPKDRIRIIIIGNGPMKKALESNLDATGLKERAILMDFIPRQNLREIYWAADVVLMPGMLEAFPIVGLEASATGKLIVGRNESGLSDLIVDGQTGFLSYSEEELSQKLAAVLSRTELIPRMGKEARERAEREFSWDVILKRLLEVYRTAINRAEEFDDRYLLYRAIRRIAG